MRQSTYFLHTLREPPADAEVVSHKLLSQAGFIVKLSAGIYSYTPPMLRVLKKIEQIVRVEMDRAGAQEVLLPALQPEEIWKDSGRWDRYQADGILFNFPDRRGSIMCLGPTHEEVMTTLARKFLSSYKNLPVNLYQIQTKFRDEIRPRFGLMRCREFIMKDAYSFDHDEQGLDVSYRAMEQAYRQIFSRCGLRFIVVDADSGAIGGAASQEFVVEAETGEDAFLICDKADYAANIERADSFLQDPVNLNEEPKPLEKLSTPGVKTIEHLVEFVPGLTADRTIKAVVYQAHFPDRTSPVVAFIRGDQEVNEVKLVNALGALGLTFPEDKEVLELTGAPAGFIGPINLKDEVTVVFDQSVSAVRNGVFGANEVDMHFINVNPGRDFKMERVIDFRMARSGELCINDQAKTLADSERQLRETRGIEVGHIFKLGTKYSEAMGSTFTDEDGRDKPFLMGCYGIGVSRIAAAAVEQSHDESGIVWPPAIAPFSVHLICLNPKKEEQHKLAEKIYAQLLEAQIEVLFDDRNASPGVKFNDADLVGIPLRVIVGRDASDGNVEFSKRVHPRDKVKLSASAVLDRVQAELRDDLVH